MAASSATTTALAPFVQLSPSKLVFDPARVTDRTTPQLVELKLTNTNESLAAAFKFRTNAPTRYTVKPVIGVIAAGGVATVHIRWEPTAGVPESNSPDKFLMQTCLVPDGKAASFNADSWKEIPKEQTVTQMLPTKFLPNEFGGGEADQTPARPAAGSASTQGTFTAASTRTGVVGGETMMEPFESFSGLAIGTSAVAGAAVAAAPSSAVAPAPTPGPALTSAPASAPASTGDAPSASPAPSAELDQQKILEKEVEVSTLRQRVTDLEAKGDLSRRRRPGWGLTKGHLVVVSALAFCIGLGWPWLRTLPPVVTAIHHVSQTWGTFSATVLLPTVARVTKFFEPK